MKVKRFVSWTNNDSDFVITNSKSEKSLVLDSTGKILWEMVLSGKSPEEITMLCIKKFADSDANVICSDINDFINMLLENDIVE